MKLFCIVLLSLCLAVANGRRLNITKGLEGTTTTTKSPEVLSTTTSATKLDTSSTDNEEKVNTEDLINALKTLKLIITQIKLFEKFSKGSRENYDGDYDKLDETIVFSDRPSFKLANWIKLQKDNNNDDSNGQSGGSNKLAIKSTVVLAIFKVLIFVFQIIATILEIKLKSVQLYTGSESSKSENSDSETLEEIYKRINQNKYTTYSNEAFDNKKSYSYNQKPETLEELYKRFRQNKYSNQAFDNKMSYWDKPYLGSLVKSFRENKYDRAPLNSPYDNDYSPKRLADLFKEFNNDTKNDYRHRANPFKKWIDMYLNMFRHDD